MTDASSSEKESQKTGPRKKLKLFWNEGLSPPVKFMTSYSGSAVVHESTAYFSHHQYLYSYTLSEQKWAELAPNPHECFGLAVVSNTLTTIGGRVAHSEATPTLFSLDLAGAQWRALFPPMGTRRLSCAATSTPNYLVVAGGRSSKGEALSVVEIMSASTHQWCEATSLPRAVYFPHLVLCNSSLYLSDLKSSAVFSSSVEDLLKRAGAGAHGSGSVWSKLPDVPVFSGPSLAAVEGRLVALGGKCDDNKLSTNRVYAYDESSSLWSVAGEMLSKRSHAITAAFPSGDLVVVGGFKGQDFSTVTELGKITFM